MTTCRIVLAASQHASSSDDALAEQLRSVRPAAMHAWAALHHYMQGDGALAVLGSVAARAAPVGAAALCAACCQHVRGWLVQLLVEDARRLARNAQQCRFACDANELSSAALAEVTLAGELPVVDAADVAAQGGDDATSPESLPALLHMRAALPRSLLRCMMLRVGCGRAWVQVQRELDAAARERAGGATPLQPNFSTDRLLVSGDVAALSSVHVLQLLASLPAVLCADGRR